MSRIFHPCILVPHFHVPQFHVSHFQRPPSRGKNGVEPRPILQADTVKSEPHRTESCTVFIVKLLQTRLPSRDTGLSAVKQIGYLLQRESRKRCMNIKRRNQSYRVVGQISCEMHRMKNETKETDQPAATIADRRTIAR